MNFTAIALAAAVTGLGDPSSWEQLGRPLPRPEHRPVLVDPRLPVHKECHAIATGDARGSVTTILPDLFKRWTLAFATGHTQAHVLSAPPYGPPQGKLSRTLQDFLDGKSDFALVSRGLTGTDLAAFKKANGSAPLVVPVAAGSWRHFGFVDTVVVIVNRANPLRGLTFAQIDAIFSASRLRGQAKPADWAQLGIPAWHGRPVHVVGGAGWLKEDSARSEVVRSRVLMGGEWSTELADGGDEATAADRVARDPFAIAVTGLGHLPGGTKAIAIAQPNGPYVKPSFANVAAARYPLSRTVDMLVKRGADGSVNPVLSDFVRFILSREGQQVVTDQGVFLPLRAAQAKASLGLIGGCSP